MGNVFYNEGIILVKSPNIPLFGTDQWDLEFQGEQTIHVLKIAAEAAAGLINSSSNPNFKVVSASLDANDADSEFVYVSNIFYLDNNLNLVVLCVPSLEHVGHVFAFTYEPDDRRSFDRFVTCDVHRKF